MILEESDTILNKLLNLNRLSLLKYLVNRKEMYDIGKSKTDIYFIDELGDIIAKKDDEIIHHVNILEGMGLVDYYTKENEKVKMVMATTKGVTYYNLIREHLLRVLT